MSKNRRPLFFMDTIIRQEDIQRNEAEMLLQRAVTISVVAKQKIKWWQLWKKPKDIKYTFEVHPLKLAQQQRIQARLAHLDESPFHNNEPIMKVYSKMMIDHFEDVVYCVGVLLSDPRKEPTRWLQDFIKNNFDNHDLEQMWGIMAKQSHVSPFLNGIVLMKGIEMNPAA